MIRTKKISIITFTFLFSMLSQANDIVEICIECDESKSRNTAFQAMIKYNPKCPTGELGCNFSDGDAGIEEDISIPVHIFTDSGNKKGFSYTGTKSATGIISIQPALKTPIKIQEYFNALAKVRVAYLQMISEAQQAIDSEMSRLIGVQVDELTEEDAFKGDNKTTDSCDNNSKYSSPLDYFKNPQVKNYVNNFTDSFIDQNPDLDVSWGQAIQIGLQGGINSPIAGSISTNILFRPEQQILNYTFSNSGNLVFVVESTPAGRREANLSLADSTLGNGRGNGSNRLSNYITTPSQNDYRAVTNQSSELFESGCLKEDWEQFLRTLNMNITYRMIDGSDWPTETCQMITTWEEGFARYRTLETYSIQEGETQVLVGRWRSHIIEVTEPSTGPCMN